MAIIYLNSRSKKTRKQKAKAKDAWEEYMKKYGLVENKARTQQIVKTTYQAPKVMPMRAGALDHKAHKSLDSGLGSATLATPKVYTGDKVIGIATMHKSNLIPIFSNEEAKDVANMRRNND